MEQILLHQFAEKLDLLRYAKRSVAEYPMYVGYFFRYLETVEGVSSIDEVTPQHITAYHTHLRFGIQDKGKILASRTVSMRLIVLKTFFRVMHAENLIKNDYSAFITPATPPRTPPAYVPSEKDMIDLLDAITPDTCPESHRRDVLSIRDRALFELLYATGMRNEEARGLTLDRLDLAGCTVRVMGKGSIERIIPLGAWVVPYLTEYLQAARPKLIAKENNILFVSKNGRALTKNILGYLLRRYAKKAGLSRSGLHPHILRHACATHLLRAGADIRYVQELLGHASLNSTQIYTKVEISFLQKAHRKYHPRERTDHGSVD